MVLRFSSQDLELFAAASHDRNSLHMSAAYARRTPYGRQVVFGILGALACLRASKAPSASRLTFEFLRPVFLDTDYALAITGSNGEATLVEVRDGSTVVLRSSITRAGDGVAAVWDEARVPAARSTPANPSEIHCGDTAAGEYLPSLEPFRLLLERFELGPQLALPAAALLLSSYLVGMELPGDRALFFKLALEFGSGAGGIRQPLAYRAQVLSVNKMNLLRASLELSSGDRAVASGEVCAFIRPADVAGESDALLPRGDNLAGKVALVMGASRGLGASLTKALVRQGCTVLANYQHSEEEARKLPREAIRVQGDAGDLDACRALDQRIAAQYGRLDFLVCNACPAPLPLRLEADTVDRINAYVGQALALATVPMAVFLDRIAQSRGWAVLISSVYIEESPKEMPHYVAVKSALEGVARIAAKQYRQASFLVVRPPRMLTDMTKMPFGNENALHPHVVAARIAARVQGARVSDAPEILTWGITD